MKSQILLVIFCFTFILQSFGQGAIKVITIDKKGEFIIPPNIRSILTCKGNLKSKYYDFVIRINNLNLNYNQCLNNISKAEICQGKFFAISGEPVDNIAPTEVKVPYCYIKSNSTNIEIKIHFHKIFYNPTESDIAKACQQLSFELLTQISELETTHSWAPSISQNIVEKIFEIIPVPQSASLDRFGYLKTPLYSVFLLNPRLQLQADVTYRDTTPFDPRGKIIKWSNQNNLSFYRDSFGHIKQVPYLNLDKTKLPTNKIGSLDHTDENSNTILVSYYNLAGSADLELSSFITNSKFIALYQPFLKSNNLSENLGSSDINNCCVSPDYDCNSQLVLSDNLNSLFVSPQKCRGGLPIYENVAVSGERSAVLVYTTIYVNNNPVSIPFGSSVIDLKSKGALPPNFQILRFYNNRLCRIVFNDSAKNNFILLPSDRIKFK